MNDHDIDPHHDERLRGILRDHADAPPFDDVDWAALHARIASDAAPMLVQARHRQVAWWQMLAAWSARATSVAATAAAAAVVMIGAGLLPERPAEASAAAAYAYITLEEALAYGSTALTAAGNDSDAVLDALLFHEDADR